MATSCDLLLTNAHVLTMDEAFTAYAAGSVAISAGKILAVGPIDGASSPTIPAPAFAPTLTVTCDPSA